ncbi:MAG: DUF3047 domain-containing protein [Calditrichaeota bacterium]|nr:MAG: DUF3047 domain-containing protein [Calditrichota bacterium]
MFSIKGNGCGKGHFHSRLIVFLMAMVSGIALSYSVPQTSAPEQDIEQVFRQWLAVAKNKTLSEEKKKEQFAKLLDRALDMNRVAKQALPKHWNKTLPYLRQRFIRALKTSIIREIQTSGFMAPEEQPLHLTLVGKKLVGEDNANLDFRLEGRSKKMNLRVFVARNESGQWKITNVKLGRKTTLALHYYKFCEKLASKYSVPYLIAELSGQDYVVLEDFEGGEPGKLPPGWKWKKKDDKKHKPYHIAVEDHNHYLAARDEGESVIIGKDIKWNIKKYRYISFRWRIHKIPKGGDERYGKTVDSAAGIYIVYKKKLGLIPESVKYVHSSTLPVGSAMRRSGVGRPWMVVASSGTDHLGEWQTFVFDAYQAYKDTFGGEPPDTAIGIGILSDANSTHSKAYADYDDIRALKHANADSGVKQKLEAE